MKNLIIFILLSTLISCEVKFKTVNDIKKYNNHCVYSFKSYSIYDNLIDAELEIDSCNKYKIGDTVWLKNK